MSSKGKSIIICLLIFLIIVFIYTPLRTDKLERQFVQNSITNVDKIVISLVGFEKNKILKNKNLSEFYTIIKKKYPSIALVTIADKNNKILKAGKDDRFIKSNTIFDEILDSFLRDEFKAGKKSAFNIRYYDHYRFYISARNIDGGKILIIFPYKLEIRIIVQLVLEILLIFIFSIILTAFIFIIKNRKSRNKTIKVIQSERKNKEKSAVNSNQITGDQKRKSKAKNIISDIDVDSLNDSVYELFKSIVHEYTPKNLSLFLIDEESAVSYRIYELKGNIFIKTEDPEDDAVELTEEIMEAFKKSSIILLDKGRKVTIPLLYGSILLGTLDIIRDRQLSGPEINNIKSQLKVIIEPLIKYHN